MYALQGEYADAAFSEVVSKSLANTVNFGEAIVLGRRCSISAQIMMPGYVCYLHPHNCTLIDKAVSDATIPSASPRPAGPHLCVVLQGT